MSALHCMDTWIDAAITGTLVRVQQHFAPTIGSGAGERTIINMKTLTLGATNVFSPTMANKFRFNVRGNDYKSSRTLDHFGAATPPRRLRHSGSTAR